MRKQIVDVYDLSDNKVCSTANKDEIKYYSRLGYKIIKTGSYVIINY